MRRIGAIGALVAMGLLSLGAVALAAVPVDADCAREAPDCCGAECPACFCCAGTVAAVATAWVGSYRVPPVTGSPEASGLVLPSADPWPILHVPRVAVPS